MAAPKKVDYEAIEPGWRAGIKSPAQLATEYTEATGIACSRSAIIKHFSKIAAHRETVKRVKAVLQKRPNCQIARDGFVYVVYIEPTAGQRIYKIGRSTNFAERFGAHQCSQPFELCVAVCYFTADACSEEKHLHERFDAQRVRGEWFNLNQEDLQWVASRSLQP